MCVQSCLLDPLSVWSALLTPSYHSRGHARIVRAIYIYISKNLSIPYKHWCKVYISKWYKQWYPNMFMHIIYIYTHAETVFQDPPPVIQKKILWSVLAGSGMSRPSPFPSIILSPTLSTTLEKGFTRKPRDYHYYYCYYYYFYFYITTTDLLLLLLPILYIYIIY